jgi:hypothetical protein
VCNSCNTRKEHCQGERWHKQQHRPCHYRCYNSNTSTNSAQRRYASCRGGKLARTLQLQPIDAKEFKKSQDVFYYFITSKPDCFSALTYHTNTWQRFSCRHRAAVAINREACTLVDPEISVEIARQDFA